jgi:MFS family permease
MKKNGIPRIKSIDSPPVSILALKKFPLSFWLLASVLSFNYATIYPFISYASDFLQLKWGYNDEEASQIVSFLSITAMITGPILGYLLDKFGKRIYAINIGNAIQIIACFLMGSTTISPFVPIIAVGFSYSLVPAAIWPSLSIIIEDDVFSSAYGLVSSLACIVLIPVYWFIGELVDQYHKIEESCWLMASFSFIGLCFGVAWQIVDKKNGTLCNLPSAILITNNNKKNNEENLENEL